MAVAKSLRSVVKVQSLLSKEFKTFSDIRQSIQVCESLSVEKGCQLVSFLEHQTRCTYGRQFGSCGRFAGVFLVSVLVTFSKKLFFKDLIEKTWNDTEGRHAKALQSLKRAMESGKFEFS